MGLDTVLSDLEAEGYQARCFVIPAVAADARHRRDRCWIIAHADREGELIAREIIEQGWINEDFVSKHCLFKKASEDIGFGLRDEGAKQDPLANEQIDFAEYRRFVSRYTPEYASFRRAKSAI